MKIKKYMVANMQEAMQIIKKDLGPNAVLVSSERAPRKNMRDFFGPRQLIITAALEEQLEKALPEGPRKEQIEAGTGSRAGGLPATAPVLRTQAGQNNGGGSDVNHPRREGPVIPSSLVPTRLADPLVDFENENRDSWFKIILNDMADNQEGDNVQTPRTKWQQVLKNLEIHDKIVEIILSDIKENGDNAEDIEELLKVSLKNNIVKLVDRAYKKPVENRIMTFIGPTGVGKTTTLVKIATRYQVFHRKSIALIALYDHRFGALEELNYYAEIIGAPIEVVMTPAELKKAVQKHQDKDYIFIDTEGRPSKNTGQILELKTFVDAVDEEQEILLVLSATTKNKDIMRIANDFSRVGISRLIFTKLDETDTLGSMINAVCEIGAPVSYITKGQNIPDDIEVVTAKKLAGIILEGFDPNERIDF